MSGAVLISLVAVIPSIALSPIVVRLAIVLPLGAWGIVWLAHMAWCGDTVARWCSAFIVWSFVASWASPERDLALYGSLSNDRMWIHHAAFVACWAVGRTLAPMGARLITGALLLGIGVNALVAMIQAAGGGRSFLALDAGRAHGLASSSVYLGGLLAAGIALVAALMADRERWWPLLVPSSLFMAAAELSGSRISLIVAVSVGLLATGRRSRIRALAFAGSCAIGLVLSSVLWSPATTGTSRLQGEGGAAGVAPRFEMWEAGIKAVAERPLTGYGSGRFRTATSPAASVEFVRAEGPDRPFFDAHNIVVEVLVAGGFIGLFLVGGLRNVSRGMRQLLRRIG